MITLPIVKPDLYKYSPHKERMLLIDEVSDYSVTEYELGSKVYITEDSVFYDTKAGYVPSWISFEYMAQSIALLSGIYAVQNGKTPLIGFIMGIRDFTPLKNGFKPGDEVTIKVKQIFREQEVVVFEGSAFCNGELYTSGTINAVEGTEETISKMRGL